jgi:hypothetical protein
LRDFVNLDLKKVFLLEIKKSSSFKDGGRSFSVNKGVVKKYDIILRKKKIKFSFI